MTQPLNPDEKLLWCCLYAARIAYWWEHAVPERLTDVPPEQQQVCDAAEYASIGVGALRRNRISVYRGWRECSSSAFVAQILEDDPQSVTTMVAADTADG